MKKIIIEFYDKEQIVYLQKDIEIDESIFEKPKKEIQEELLKQFLIQLEL